MNLKWTRELAYVVGLITTDGSLSKDGRHIDFTSKDLDQVKAFKKLVGSKCKIGIKRNSQGNISFRLQLGGVKFYKFLQSIGLHPNKSKTIKEVLIPDKYFIDFLRGHFDGDEFSYSYWDKRWKSSFMLYIGFISASKKHLEWIQKTICRLYSIHGKIKFSGRSVYQLMYAKASSVALYSHLYYNRKVVCLKRKRFKLESSLGIIRRQAGMLKLVYRHA